MPQLYICNAAYNLMCSVVYSCDMISWNILQNALQVLPIRPYFPKGIEFVKDCSSTDGMDITSFNLSRYSGHYQQGKDVMELGKE